MAIEVPAKNLATPTPESIDSEAVALKKNTVPRGRPVSRPASKATIFHLPLDLIAKIDQEATKNMLGNKSALAVKIFSDYFEKMDH